MPTDVPLLNDYKRGFVRRRLLQTFLAGIRLTGCPWYSVIAQLVNPLFIISPEVGNSTGKSFVNYKPRGR